MKRIFLLATLIFTISAFAQHGSVKSIDFNGSTDYVEIPNNPALDPSTKFTVEAWIKADSWATSAWQNTIVSKDMWSSISEGWVLRCGANGTLSFNLALNSNSSWYEVTSSPSMSVNKWYHVAGTYDGNTMRLYLNGKQVGTLSQAGTITPSSAPVKIGNIAMVSQSRFFDGEIDEVRIWDETLSQNTLRQYMCHKIDGNHPNLTNLVAHYTLNTGSGNAIYDLSGNGLNGTKVGGVWNESGAPLGDGSGYVYNTSWSGKVFKYGHSTGDSVLISNVSGNPNGAHIYFIDAPANYSTPPAGVVSLTPDRYYGVFLTEGNNTAYKLTFEYNGFPGIQNQSKLNLNYRTDHSDATWQTINAVIDTVQKTMIKTNSDPGEFIIGFNDALTAFDLNAPVNGSSFNIQGMSNQTVPFNWHSSKLLLGGGSNYKWYLDFDTASFTTPIATKNSSSGGSDTLVAVTYSDIGSYMTNAGVYYGETLKAKWTVKAIAGPVEKNANQSHTIDLVRGIISTDAIFNFFLDKPDNDTLFVFNGGSALIPFTWNPANSTAGPNISYEIQLAGENGSFNNPLGVFPADNSGLDTVANVSDADVATMLQNASIPNNVLVKFKWRVVASLGTLSKNSIDSNFVFIKRLDDPTIGIQENKSRNNTVSIYPNPTHSSLNIKSINVGKISAFKITNNIGEVVWEKKDLNELEIQIILPETIQSGAYHCLVYTETNMLSKSFVLVR